MSITWVLVEDRYRCYGCHHSASRGRLARGEALPVSRDRECAECSAYVSKGDWIRGANPGEWVCQRCKDRSRPRAYRGNPSPATAVAARVRDAAESEEDEDADWELALQVAAEEDPSPATADPQPRPAAKRPRPAESEEDEWGSEEDGDPYPSSAAATPRAAAQPSTQQQGECRCSSCGTRISGRWYTLADGSQQCYGCHLVVAQGKPLPLPHPHGRTCGLCDAFLSKGDWRIITSGPNAGRYMCDTCRSRRRQEGKQVGLQEQQQPEDKVSRSCG